MFKSYLYISSEPLQMQSYAASDRISYVDAVNGDYHPIALHTKFTPLWSTHWVRVNYTIPPEWAGQEVHLRWDSSSEATIWHDHQPIRGLSGEGPHWNSPYHDTYILTPSAIAGESGHFHIEVAVNTPFGQLDKSPTSDLGFLRLAEIALFNREMWDLYWDFAVVADMAHHFPADGLRAGSALAVANEMINLFQPEDVNSIQSARDLAATFLSQQNGAGIHQVYAMGHAHIDTAWLWPLAETRRKCVRSFSTAVHLMERYPDYKFVCSQAQQLAWIKDDQPELYRKIKEKSVEGQFVFVGGSWVEPDCNLPSGEALVRQFLYGQRFFESEFGSTHDNFWLPDTFGYSPALPQIMRGVGISYFLTQKLSWNQFNKLPANTFYWEGLDGSRVLTHFPPADTYNGLGNVREIVEGTSRFRDHDRSDASIYLFGFGDGGGGPSAKMLEQLARMEDVNGLPIVQQNTPSAFFEHVEATAHDLAIWVGELYFEAHRGTYTTQGYTKWANRRGQQQLHNAEFLTVLAQLDLRQELTLLWQRLLLNQFHDILPGSSIKEVYDDASDDYKLILSQSQSHINHALETVLPDNTTNNTYTVVNTLSHPRRAVIELPFEWSTSQKSADDKPLALVETPSLGYQQQTSTDNGHP
ncbi:MAG: alpha-mannosidase, partial [Chloroflexota bacterium]